MNKEQMKIELIELNYLITQFIKKSPEFDRDNELAKLIGVRMTNLKTLAYSREE